MNLKQYAKKLNELAEKYPNAKVIYSIDEEGNGYNEVIYTPSACKFENGEVDCDGLSVKDVNAVIIN